MVGLVIVSHSARLAEGVAELVHGVGGEDVAVATAGGLDLPDRPLGTDATLVLQAIETVYSDDGVLVLMDLGSALLSAELALDLLPPEQRNHVALCEAPLVEGAVAAAVQARLGSPLAQVAAEARGALAAKAAHLGGQTFGVVRPRRPETSKVSETSQVSRQERRLRVRNPAGLHARPAAAFVQTAGGFPGTDITLQNLTGGRGPVNARSINAVITLGVRQGDEILLTASGPGAIGALDALATLMRELADDETGAASQPVQAAGGGSAAGWPLRGTPASPGVAVGRIHHHAPTSPDDERNLALNASSELPASDPAAEWEALQAALSRTAEQIRATRARVAARSGEAAAGIFDAQLLFLQDDALLSPARSAIFQAGQSASAAWRSAVGRLIERYAALNDRTLRSRGADLADVAQQVSLNLDNLPPSLAADGRALPTPSATPVILVARELQPTETAQLDLNVTLGICMAQGGPTSHAAILARALGIPCITGLGEALLALPQGSLVAMDGATGGVWPNPPDELVEEYAQRAQAERAARTAEPSAAMRRDEKLTAVTRDGHRVEIAANIGSIMDAATAVNLGADGIGLLRTEFLFAGRQAPPEEEEQVAAYRAIAAMLGGRPLVIRSLDAGGDKPLPYLPMPAEANPFLGQRGIRLCLARPEIFLPQLRAIVRVAAEFPVKLMFPMIATLAEWRAAVALLAAAREEVLARGERAPAAMETGIMVEVPAAALLAREFADEADFFSLGTNDLAQYLLAAERGNPQLSALADPLQPALLRLVQRVVAAGHERGRRVGVCGELAADPLAIPLLVGLGVDELSMTPRALPAARGVIRDLYYHEAVRLADMALQAADAEAIHALLSV